ncbi:MAG TPA: DUF2177 family protein [Caulobacteraceae bacterium]|jgi:uncharacterized membrane protein|nr:DUF2177 family protein [Caulobacteraceae bacterium]
MTRLQSGILAAGAMAVSFLGLDAAWLTATSARLYRPMLAPVLYSGGARPAPAAAFYLVYLTGLWVLAAAPSLKARDGWARAARRGGLFGFFAYATYDLTNQATLAVWSTKITLLDLAWGSAASSCAAAAGYLVGVAARGSEANT